MRRRVQRIREINVGNTTASGVIEVATGVIGQVPTRI